MPELAHLKGKYKDDKCVIFGNGPSLTIEQVRKSMDLGIFSFVVNGFCLMLDDIDFIPDAVCMSNFDAIKKFALRYPEETLKFFKASWRQHADFTLENVYDLPFDCEHDRGKHNAPFIKDGNFTLDPSEVNYCGDTVVLDFAVPLAFYMGFREMYFLGVDCDYSRGYFSDKYAVSAKENFRGMVNNDFSIAIPSFRFAKDFLARQGRKLYKLTDSRRLDFIETCSLKQAFRSVHK